MRRRRKKRNAGRRCIRGNNVDEQVPGQILAYGPSVILPARAVHAVLRFAQAGLPLLAANAIGRSSPPMRYWRAV